MPQKNKPGVSEEKEMFGVPPEDYMNNIAPLHFKWIISPESQNVDLKLLAHTIIKHVENLTGYELYWRGVIHTDTGHHHLHIVVNGKDKNGKKVRFPKDMIKNTTIPLPPFAEQKRIVTAIERAFAQLDEIANSIS